MKSPEIIKDGQFLKSLKLENSSADNDMDVKERDGSEMTPGALV